MQPLGKFRPKTSIKAPRHLRPATKKWFLKVAEDYVLEEHHIRLLTLAAESWDRSVMARESIATTGLTYITKSGEPRRHPAVQIEHDAKIAFVRVLRELALDVSAPDETRPPGIRGR